MRWKNLHLQPLRFVLSGGLATACHWLVMALLMSIGILPALATAVGALFGAVVNYFLQRNVTFRSNLAHRPTLLRYLSVCTLTWGINLILFLTLHRIVLLSPMAAQGITTFAVALISYFLYRRIVFHDHQSRPV